MKILVVSNLYPPHCIGGYEIRCSLVAQGLRAAGHDVRILTSRYGLPSDRLSRENIDGVQVERLLGQYHHSSRPPTGWPYFLARVRPQIRDAHCFIRTLEEFKPDLVSWWAISGLTPALLSIPRLRGIPDVFFVEDDWLVEERGRGEDRKRPQWAGLWKRDDKPWYWRPALVGLMEKWRARLLKQGIETSAAPFVPSHVCFVSEFLRDHYLASGFTFPSTEVLYGGVPLEKFFFKRQAAAADRQSLRLLYAGFISRDRGLTTVLRALSALSPERKSRTTLTIVGEYNDAQYYREVCDEILRLRLSPQVCFVGKKNYEEMPGIYRAHDVLVAPSARREGLPLSMTEAMLSGCAVVTTGSGGAAEIARRADLPLFEKDDGAALTRILEQLIDNRHELERIAVHGQDVAVREYSSARMIERFCRLVENLHETRKPKNLSAASARRRKLDHIAQDRL